VILSDGSPLAIWEGVLDGMLYVGKEGISYHYQMARISTPTNLERTVEKEISEICLSCGGTPLLYERQMPALTIWRDT